MIHLREEGKRPVFPLAGPPGKKNKKKTREGDDGTDDVNILLTGLCLCCLDINLISQRVAGISRALDFTLIVLSGEMQL